MGGAQLWPLPRSPRGMPCPVAPVAGGGGTLLCSQSSEIPACPSDLMSYHFIITHHVPATLLLLLFSPNANSFSPQDVCTCHSLHLEHAAPDLPSHGWLPSRGPQRGLPRPAGRTPGPCGLSGSVTSSRCLFWMGHSDGSGYLADVLVALFLSASSLDGSPRRALLCMCCLPLPPGPGRTPGTGLVLGK